MGDHRASIQIKFEMHGIEKEIDMWINWYDNGYGIDDRIIDFFQEASNEAINKHEQEVWEYNKAEREKKSLEEDKIKYEELKKRFEVRKGFCRTVRKMK